MVQSKEEIKERLEVHSNTISWKANDQLQGYLQTRTSIKTMRGQKTKLQWRQKKMNKLKQTRQCCKVNGNYKSFHHNHENNCARMI